VEYTCQPDFVYDYDNWYDYGYITGTSYGDVPEAPPHMVMFLKPLLNPSPGAIAARLANGVPMN
jgi:hypothetical protein